MKVDAGETGPLRELDNTQRIDRGDLRTNVDDLY